MAGRKDNGKWETCQQAYQSAANFIDRVGQSGSTIADMAMALHSIQDSYSSSHQYAPWYGNLTIAHEEGDAVTPAGAEVATANFLRDVLANGRPDSAEKYLAPLSVCK